jgi:uncharacterized protein YodC (DUF2158 family)
VTVSGLKIVAKPSPSVAEAGAGAGGYHGRKTEGSLSAVEKKTFSIGSKQLQVRSYAENGMWRCRVFDGDNPLTPTIEVKVDDLVDAQVTGRDLKAECIALAQAQAEEILGAEKSN